MNIRILTAITTPLLTLAGGISNGLAAELKVSHLKCEGLDSPTLVDTGNPRFSWRLESPERGVLQTAYQLRLVEIDSKDQPTGELIETSRISSDTSQWVEIPGFTARPDSRYEWQVQVWDKRNGESGWSAKATFGTGLVGGPWRADWLSDGRIIGKNAAPPARYFRKAFDLPEAPIRARLYLSAQGIVEPWLNGSKVTEDLFLPGWPEYTKRNYYVAYDVAPLMQKGANAIGLVLGEGWYSSTLLGKHQYGPTPKLSGWLEITNADGTKKVIPSDASWQWAEGPIRENGIYPGETYDARRADENWCRVNGCAWDWQPVKVEPRPEVDMTARISQPVRRIQELKPVSRRKISPGVFIYDFGQNMVGWVRLKVKAAAGSKVQIRFTEMLEADGTLHTKNLRGARATATYFARGSDLETWEPCSTFFGFRYAEISGVEEPLPDALTGVVVHSDLPRIGRFECSNPMLNQLFTNTLWGQKGNFLELPTDCPQRDERLGWTGDAQVFCNTAHYNLNSGAFYRQWLTALRDGFVGGANGGFGSVAPHVFGVRGSAGWSDAGVIVPWVTWIHTADRRMLEDNLEAAQRWVDLQATHADKFIRRSKPSYGDWLAPGYEPGKAPTPYVLIATAYFARSAQLTAEMAAALGRTEQAEKNRALFQQIKAAFRKEFIADDGKIVSDEQTAYLLALAFDLTPTELRPQMEAHLVRTIAAKNNHLATGFIGTPLLTPVLTQMGRSDLAYKVVLQESYPGWLFSVKNGATTIWERWNSWTPEDGFNKDGMNSFNHYAYGSVVEWFYDTIAGLKPDPTQPGWKRFEIAPTPGGGLTHAEASLETPYGPVASAWKKIGNDLEMKVTIPPNTTACLRLPTNAPGAILADGQALAKLSEASAKRVEQGRVAFDLPSGTYRFAIRPAANR